MGGRGPEKQEVQTGSPEDIKQRLEQAHANGMRISDKVGQQLKSKEGDDAFEKLLTIQTMGENLMGLEKIRTAKIRRGNSYFQVPFSDADSKLIEGNLRHINSMGEKT